MSFKKRFDSSFSKPPLKICFALSHLCLILYSCIYVLYMYVYTFCSYVVTIYIYIYIYIYSYSFPLYISYIYRYFVLGRSAEEAVAHSFTSRHETSSNDNVCSTYRLAIGRSASSSKNVFDVRLERQRKNNIRQKTRKSSKKRYETKQQLDWEQCEKRSFNLESK